MCSVRSFAFNSSMFSCYVAGEETWPLKFRPWLMWSGFNETQWVDWTCSFTRGGGGARLQLDSDFLSGGRAFVTWVRPAFLWHNKQATPGGEPQGWGLSHETEEVKQGQFSSWQDRRSSSGMHCHQCAQKENTCGGGITSYRPMSQLHFWNCSTFVTPYCFYHGLWQFFRSNWAIFLV